MRENSLEQEFLESLRDDIRARRPRMVCIQDAEDRMALPIHFNMRTYLDQTGIVALLRELGYREESLREHWAAFVAPGRSKCDGPRHDPRELDSKDGERARG